MLSSVLIYVGSYTPDAGGKGTGITVWGEDLQPAAPTVALPGPSWLTPHPAAPVLFAVNELDEGGVTALAIGPEGALDQISQQGSGGSLPCRLDITADGRHLLCANYGSGSVAVFAIKPDGTIGARTDLMWHAGSGPVRDRQEGPHAHQVVVDGDQVTAVDLGTDSLYGYRLRADGTLATEWVTDCGAGTGPRHLAGPADGRRYCADELASTVSTYVPDPKAGGLRLVHRRLATLADPAGENYPSEIALSADGRFVYVGNRGNDSIATFAVDGDELVAVDEVPTGGAWPRHFAIDGDLMYVANERSDTVTLLRIDPATGVPRPTGERLDVPSPAFVLVRRP
jgi:6-phosphogluconolactonase (cycloisomerase 2 family)